MSNDCKSDSRQIKALVFITNNLDPPPKKNTEILIEKKYAYCLKKKEKLKRKNPLSSNINFGKELCTISFNFLNYIIG